MNFATNLLKKQSSDTPPAMQDYEKLKSDSHPSGHVPIGAFHTSDPNMSNEKVMSFPKSSVCFSSNNGSTDTKKAYSKNKKDKFVPKRDRRMERLLGKIESDDDIWVERFYQNKKGYQVPYFRSVCTNRCVRFEPPTGSGIVVTWNELDKYPFLKEFATEPLDRPLTEIEKPDYKGPTYKQRRQGAGKKSKK